MIGSLIQVVGLTAFVVGCFMIATIVGLLVLGASLVLIGHFADDVIAASKKSKSDDQ